MRNEIFVFEVIAGVLWSLRRWAFKRSLGDEAEERFGGGGVEGDGRDSGRRCDVLEDRPEVQVGAGLELVGGVLVAGDFEEEFVIGLLRDAGDARAGVGGRWQNEKGNALGGDGAGEDWATEGEVGRVCDLVSGGELPEVRGAAVGEIV